MNDIFPKLSAYLQLASNSALKGAPTQANTNNNNTPLLDIKTSPPSSPAEVTKMILATPLSTTNSTVSATSTTVTTTTTSNTNKISLVPTNILMKPTTTQSQTNAQPTAQFSFKPQQFICAKSGSGTQTVYTTTNGGMPMKVLLVNTLQKPAATATTISGTITPAAATTASITTRPIVSIQSKAQHQTTHPVIQSTYQTRSATANANAAAATVKTSGTTLSSNKYLYSGSTTNEASNRRSLQWKYQKTTPGFRNLLNQLVQLQNKNLEIAKQRLDIERERLDFEKSTGGKILNVLTALLQPKNETTADKE